MTLFGQTVAKPQWPHGPRDDAMRLARSCYDYLAGRLGVAIADATQRRHLVRLADGVGLVTDEASVSSPTSASTSARCRGVSAHCVARALTGAKHRPHLADKLGVSILEGWVELAWLVRTPKSLTLRIGRAGECGFAETFRCEPVWMAASTGFSTPLPPRLEMISTVFAEPIGRPSRPLYDRCNSKRRLKE